MADSGSWRPLPLESSPQLPTLLSSIQTGTNDYTVQITDTANLWVESLDFKAIRVRGWSEGTSLDPSDSPENMKKLLACLRAALEPSHKDHDQTTMSLCQASPSDAGEGGLTVKITFDLPGLKPLEWPMHLRKASSSAISSALVLPLVQDQRSRAQEIESLTAMLAQKDAVLTKLLDKLEATGTGLEQIFNQLSGKKKVSRPAAADKVRGLAPFDRQQWQKDLGGQKGPSNTDVLIREVFKGDSVQQRGYLDTEDSPKLDRWWLDLEGTLQIPQSGRASKPRQHTPSKSPLDHDTPVENDDDGDFQMQETPPHLVSRSKPKESRETQAADDASTDSEDDELAASQPVSKDTSTPKPSAEAAPKSSAGRMGAIGGRKPSPPKRPASPMPTSSTAKAADDSDTASDVAENDGYETASTASASPPPLPPKKTAPKGRMGQIGGQAPKPTPSPSDGDAKKDETSSRQPRLGTIGKGQTSKATEGQTEQKDTARGRQTTREAGAAKEEPRETSTERADRRRAELKKDLEKKAAAGPAKKKRKF